MKLYKWLGVVSVFVIVLGLAFFLKVRHDQQYRKTFLVNSKPVTVRVYKLPEPLRIDMLYKGGMDLDAYPWMRSIMFDVNAFGLAIPESEWPNYTDSEWTPKLADATRKRANDIKKAVEDETSAWHDCYNVLNEVVLCNFEGKDWWMFELIGKKANGDDFGGSQTLIVQRMNGFWKQPRDFNPDIMDFVHKAMEMALKEVKEGRMKTRSAKDLK
jgi:hypothetical protein